MSFIRHSKIPNLHYPSSMAIANTSVYILLTLDVNLKSTIFNIIVVAKRSRHHAGTRYNKRGINPDGFVANFV
jgi:hypothetical protein